MRRDRLGPLLLAASAVALTGACGETETGSRSADPEPAAGTGALVVYTVNYPLAYFAERIGGDAVEVVLPAPAGVDPAMWVPDSAALAGYQTADLILLNGAGYADWIDRVSLPPSRLVNTSATAADRYVREEAAATHSHGPEGEHAHGDIAFTTWLDATIAADQARKIAAALARRRPDASPAFDAALAELVADLETLDAELMRISATVPGQPLLASHPVYQYVAARYGLNLVSLHWEPEQEPSAGMEAELAEAQAGHAASFMLWEAPPRAATVEMLRASGIESVVFDPVAGAPAAGDYLSIMRDNAANLARAFQTERGE